VSADGVQIKLVGLDGLLKDFEEMPDAVASRAADKGIREAAMFLRNRFKKAAPKRSGTLRKSIKFKYSRKSKRAWIGLRKNQFYKTLEFDTARGPAMHPFFKDTYERNKVKAANIVVRAASLALEFERTKMLARSRARKRTR
jgi:HK97 gp10 family phage protein